VASFQGDRVSVDRQLRSPVDGCAAMLSHRGGGDALPVCAPDVM
jgi:hypothetical protein